MLGYGNEEELQWVTFILLLSFPRPREAEQGLLQEINQPSFSQESKNARRGGGSKNSGEPAARTDMAKRGLLTLKSQEIKLSNTLRVCPKASQVWLV